MERILPAYPIFVKDPNFSLWSDRESLNEGNVKTWYGEEKRIYGFLKTKGKTYCFLGDTADFTNCGVLTAQQTAIRNTTFSTDYTFVADGTRLNVRFVSPMPLDDLQLTSLPVCYLEYEIVGDDRAEVSLFVGSSLASNALSSDRRVRGGALQFSGFECVVFGLKRQLPLSNSGDLIGADWGYWYLGGEKAFLIDGHDIAAYLVGGLTSFSGKGEEKYLASINRSKRGMIMLGYDELASIDYFGEYKKGIYLENHTILEGLEFVYQNHEKINLQLNEFEKKLTDATKKYGEDYLAILNASYRQSIAAHKIIHDDEGKLLFLSKECGSNGCIGTVDVSYPSMPLFLLYAPELVKGMMRPILKFANMPVWQYDFAPHDVGTYPSCCGQVYGVNWKNMDSFMKSGSPLDTHFPIYLLPANFDAFNFDMQMPVEECANVLVMFLACYRADNDLTFFQENQSLCATWVEYLVKYGLKPENQLCTDDFAGHLKNNINLAIKATVGIAAYAELSGHCDDRATAKKYRKIAEDFATQIVAFGNQFRHLPITWDTDDETFSLKYNFAFDKLLGLNLFPQSVLEREVDCYLARQNEFGTPLDSRKGYTKSDWLVWAASLTDDEEKARKMIAPIAAYLKGTPDRIPFGDWYETEGGKYHEFRARSVQGGCFILLMK